MSLDTQAMSRREVLQATVSAVMVGSLSQPLFGQAENSPLQLATFRCEATPPIGHPCCGGWISPIKQIDDRYWANGVILLGTEKPVVLCAVDWCTISNQAHITLRQTLATAAGTTPERVAIHCVHPHNAPMADLHAQELLAHSDGAPQTLMVDFFHEFSSRLAKTVREALPTATKVTHVGTGQADVIDVAANRRILGPDGSLLAMRGSACSDPKLRAEQVGLIDPKLKTVTFWNGEQLLVALHYYACHPMSYYGDGRGTPDFCSLAREALQAETQVPQLYFTGCAGNIAAGKFNDGTPPMRAVLRDRILAGMKGALASTQKEPVTCWSWKHSPVHFQPRKEVAYSPETNQKILADTKQAAALRGRAAMQLAWHQRREQPIEITALRVGNLQLLHLPGEPFIEYQLFAQKSASDQFICTAGYGDGGTWYIPTAEAYPQGGYEVSVSWVNPETDKTLRLAIQNVLS